MDWSKFLEQKSHFDAIERLEEGPFSKSSPSDLTTPYEWGSRAGIDANGYGLGERTSSGYAPNPYPRDFQPAHANPVTNSFDSNPYPGHQRIGPELSMSDGYVSKDLDFMNPNRYRAAPEVLDGLGKRSAAELNPIPRMTGCTNGLNGIYSQTRQSECTECEGTGRIKSAHLKHAFSRTAVVYESKCKSCNGSGKI